MKKILFVFLLAAIVLIGVVVYKTFAFKSRQVKTNFAPVEINADPSILGEAITFQTISHKRQMLDDSAFVGFHKFLQRSFPLTDSRLEKEVINDFSIIYTWRGSDPEKKPLVLTAHMDVVPVEYSTLDQWEAKPFSGEKVGEFIYGRGTIDDKGSLIAILQAVESLLQSGFTPTRTLIICLGHDEEIGGDEGAVEMAAHLKRKGVEAWMVLDEGGTLAKGIVPGINETVALVGTSEKGYVSLELSASLSGGHSSMPEERNALEVVNEALYKLKQNPLPNRLSDPLEGFISHIGPHLPFTQRMAFANTWLFKPLIFSVYEKSAAGSALVRTTQVATVFNSGIKDNVVPNRARAVVNYRLLPGDEPKAILERARDIIGDTAVKVVMLDGFGEAASPVSDHESQQFRYLAGIIRSVNPGVLVSPYLVLGATDGRHYYSIGKNVFRFSPIPLESEDLERIHGINERISIRGFRQSVTFYATLIRNS